MRNAAGWVCVHSMSRWLRLLILTGAMTPAPLAARVGVTSETDGDPRGKPPAQAERVLRVGIDIQADELITTRGDDRAHLVFLDGTALTVSPNARLRIDRFVYDPAGKTGDIAVTATAGVFRLVGGRVSKGKPIVVNTPSATIGLRGGIGVFTVGPDATTAQFLFGSSMTVTAGGRTQTATRQGSQIHATFGGVPGVPSLIPHGGVAPAFARLEAGQPKPNATGAADDQAKRSGFSDRNSGQGRGMPVVSTLTDSLMHNISSNVLSQIRPAAQPVLQPSAIVPVSQAPAVVIAPPLPLPPPPAPPQLPYCP